MLETIFMIIVILALLPYALRTVDVTLLFVLMHLKASAYLFGGIGLGVASAIFDPNSSFANIVFWPIIGAGMFIRTLFNQPTPRKFGSR